MARSVWRPQGMLVGRAVMVVDRAMTWCRLSVTIHIGSGDVRKVGGVEGHVDADAPRTTARPTAIYSHIFSCQVGRERICSSSPTEVMGEQVRRMFVGDSEIVIGVLTV